MEYITSLFKSEPAYILYCGITDAVKIQKCFILLLQSSLLRYRTVQCLFLNGVIFLGSILLFNHIVSPALRYIISFGPENVFFDYSFALFKVAYHILWIYPIYCISFILNTVMYQDLADEAFAISSRMVSDKPRRNVTALRRIVDEIYRLILNLIFIVWMHVLFFIPFIGQIIYFVHVCWLASLYAFEYKWVSLKWNTAERMQYFEKHWLYFLGFGLPVSTLSIFMPRLVDTGVFAILFPFFIFTSTMAHPKPITSKSNFMFPSRIPIFIVAQIVGRFVFRVMEGISMR